MSDIRKVFGPPGSGKTTYLLNVVDRELGGGLSPMQIGYFSFTKKAATEAKDRAIEKFPALNARTDFPYFPNTAQLGISLPCRESGLHDEARGLPRVCGTSRHPIERGPRR
jgi:ATP:corrinoid adenosyltransferase